MLAYLLLVTAVAVGTYLGMRALLEGRLVRPHRPRRPRPAPPERPFAPDDDDEFLAELDRRRRSSGD